MPASACLRNPTICSSIPDHHATSAAEVVGMGRQRYEQAKEVVEAVEHESEKFGDIVEAMDSTGNVSATHTELRRRRDNRPALRHPLPFDRGGGAGRSPLG
jgi:hypothetical protein